MTRKEFLTALNQYLVTLSPEEKADIISDYEEHFRVGLENGKTEEEIASALGSPYDAASQFLDGEQPQKPNYAQPQRPNYAAQQMPGGGAQQSYQQRQGYASQQPPQQRQGYASQQPNQQGQSYTSQQNYQQPQNDGYVTYDRQDYAPQQSGSRYNTTGIIIVVVLCVILIPTVGSTIVGLLAGLYGAVIGFAVSGVGLITAGATLIPGVSMWVSVGLILMGVSFIALTGLLIMASVEGTKLFIKLIKYCIKEGKKMIMEGSF
ncbi:MAG: HAAS signaling domain-containing protein [Acutalibacteraceae bacterium]